MPIRNKSKIKFYNVALFFGLEGISLLIIRIYGVALFCDITNDETTSR